MRLSAIVPNYNHASVVSEAIAAIAAQEPAPDEIIVVDDGSTDSSVDVLERLGAQYPNLRVIRLEKNMGAIFALNRGLQEARGEYVYFGAADDLVRPGLFAAMLDALAKHPEAAFACCESVIIDVATNRRYYRPPTRPAFSASYLSPGDVARRLRHTDNWILTGTAICRRDLMAEAGGFDATLGSFADGYAMRRLALLHGCCFVPRLGLVWRVSSQGLSRGQAADPTVSLNVLRAAQERMQSDPAFPGWYPKVFERRWRFGMGRLAAEARPMNRAVLTKVSARGPVGRAVLGGAAGIGGRMGELLALGWLGFRERPMSIANVAMTLLSRLRSTRMSGTKYGLVL